MLHNVSIQSGSYTHDISVRGFTFRFFLLEIFRIGEAIEKIIIMRLLFILRTLWNGTEVIERERPQLCLNFYKKFCELFNCGATAISVFHKGTAEYGIVVEICIKS